VSDVHDNHIIGA